MTDRPTAAPDGVLRWPADPALFVDTTRCPACFAPLPSTRCAACGLDLGVAASAELLAIGTRLHAESATRAQFIARMREAQAADAMAAAPVRAPVAPPAAAPAAQVATPEPAAVVAPVPVASAAPIAVPPAVEPAAAPRPRRSGVQVFLLGLGVVLLSITAIVFLFYAYLVTSLEVRSVITAGLSVAVLGIAWLLRARRLPGTAEGVAAVAVVLLLLDVWIVRANDLFGTGALDAVGYTGGALLVVAALLAGTRRVTGIRTTGFAAATLLPVAVGLLASQLAPEGDWITGLWAGALAVAVLGAASLLLPPLPERTILLSAGFAGGGIALLSGAFAMPDLEWSSLWALLAAAGAWLLLVVALGLRRGTVAPTWRPVAATLFGFSATLAPAVSIAVELESSLAMWLAPAVAGAVVCLLAFALRRAGLHRGAELGAFVAGAVVAAGSAAPGAVLGLASAAARVYLGSDGGVWRTASASMPEADLRLAMVLTPVVIAVGAAAVLAVLGRLARSAAIPVGAALAAAIVAGAVVDSVWATAAIWLAVALGALAWAGFARRTASSLLAVAVIAGVSAAILAWCLGFTTPDVWALTSLGVLLAAVGGRALATRIWGGNAKAVGLAHVVIASVLVVAILAALVWWLELQGVRFDEPGAAPWLVLGSGSALLVGVAGLVRVGTAGDRIAFTVPLLASAVVGTAGVVIEAPDATWSWLPATLLAAATVPWLLPAAPAGLRIAAATIAPLALGAATWLLTLDLDARDALGYALAGAALASAGLAHLVSRGRGDAAMIGWSAAVGLVGLVALTWSLSGTGGSFAGSNEPWLVFAILSPVPIVLAALAGDPIGGDSPVRHFAWLSAALAVFSVWSWFLGDGVDEVEAFTLPLAVALVVCGLLITWRREPAGDGASSRGRTALFAVAAGVAVLPSAASAGDSELRTLVLVAAGAVLALAAGFAPQRVRGVPARLLVAATGWTAFTAAALVRGLAVAQGADSVLPIEFWPAIALIGGILVTVVWARAGSRPTRVAEAGFAASFVAASLPTLYAVVTDQEPSLRAALLFSIVGVAHVVGVALPARPIAGPIFAWTSRGILVIGGLIALSVATVDPFDLVTVPVALAFIAAGAIAMRRSPELGSWPALGAGLAILLLPALLADFLEPEMWRLVALGVVALAVLLVGVFRRLQAPFVLGGGVLLVHAVVQLWPAITWLYEAVWWWLWLGIAGMLLVVLAATYERQLRLARTTISSIAALR
ncbi:SCO7613 C-terminal domain-containing membrane protein [Agromyces sp. NPDC058136]|uniref:SCO7613 C-terminal domain-containing membrane protein n=1 Tax=Agromyces sp. NPDC058136 TaxID=3346354 RepID=UPI0036DF28A3